MKKKTITIKSEEFKYPTLDERKEVKKIYPEIKNFGFKYVDDFELLFQDKPNPKQINKEVNLFSWDNYLITKFGKLHMSFVNMYANYMRGIPDIVNESTKEQRINKIQFDFYAETVYYFLFSSRDIVLQLLNIFYELGFEVDKVNVNTIKHNVNNQAVVMAIETLSTNINEAAEIRNSLTHRFPDNVADNRTKITEHEDFIRLHGGSGKHKTSKEIMDNLISSLNHFSDYLNELKVIMELPNQS